MIVDSLDHVNLRADASLLERLRDYYRDVIGLRQGERPAFRSRGYWLCAGDRAVLHLTECAAEEDRDGHGTYDHLALACRGRAAFESRLNALGVSYRRAEVPGTGRVQLFLKDPGGNGIELSFAGEGG